MELSWSQWSLKSHLFFYFELDIIRKYLKYQTDNKYRVLFCHIRNDAKCTALKAFRHTVMFRQELTLRTISVCAWVSVVWNHDFVSPTILIGFWSMIELFFPQVHWTFYTCHIWFYICRERSFHLPNVLYLPKKKRMTMEMKKPSFPWSSRVHRQYTDGRNSS